MSLARGAQLGRSWGTELSFSHPCKSSQTLQELLPASSTLQSKLCHCSMVETEPKMIKDKNNNNKKVSSWCWSTDCPRAEPGVHRDPFHPAPLTRAAD